MLLITSIVAGLLSLILIKLSFAVINLRRENKVSLGSGGNDALERAIRAQANFTEYVPTGLILILKKGAGHEIHLLYLNCFSHY
jgi:uncharacterized membrane protein YecN with MAPEG domain